MDDKRQPEVFLDLFKRPVFPGDYVMFPVNTVMRFAVVKEVASKKSLYVSYFQVHKLEHHLRKRTYAISAYNRDVIKIAAEEVENLLAPIVYVPMRDLCEKYKAT